jgi:hypothetical protein
MQTVKAYFEDKNTKILAYIVGFSSATEGIGIVGYNEVRTVYSTPLVIYSGVNNPIKIQCLNSDQKRINVSNANIQCGLFVPNTQNELITANATSIDSANGVVEIIFTPSQISPLDFGMYEIGLVATDANLNAYPVYIDDNYGSRLSIRLDKGPVLAYPDPTPLTFLDVTDVGVVSNQINLTNRPMNSTLATLCANLVLYTGNIIAQGSLVSIPLPTDWANISLTGYSNAAGLVFQNVSGSFAWLRFVLDTIDPSKTGNLSPSNIAAYISGGNIRI